MNFIIDRTNLMIAGTRGDSGILNFNFIEDMRGYSAIFTVKQFADDSDDSAIVTKYFDFPALSSDVTDSEMKTMTVTLNPEDTLSIVLDSDLSVKYNDYIWGLKIYRGPVFTKTVIPLGAATFPKFRVYYGINDDWGNTSPYFNPTESSITVDIGLSVYGTLEQTVQTSFEINQDNLMITGTRGDSGLLSFIFSDDMRGYSVLFCIKKYQEDSDADAILTKSFDFPALSSDATDIEKTVMSLSFIPEDTVSLDLNAEESVKYNDYVWGMKIYRGPVFSKTLIPSNGISFPKFRLFYGINKTWGNDSPYYTGESPDINVDVTNTTYYVTQTELDFAVEQHNEYHYSHPFILSGLADLSASILSGGDNLSAHIYDFNNPHHVTHTQIGLGNVENISISGSISTHNLNLSAHDDIRDYITTHIYDTNNPHIVNKEQVGLGNVDNTSDLNKPISTLTSTALSAKADLSGGVVPHHQLPMLYKTNSEVFNSPVGFIHSFIRVGNSLFGGSRNGPDIIVKINDIYNMSSGGSEVLSIPNKNNCESVTYNKNTGKLYFLLQNEILELHPDTMEYSIYPLTITGGTGSSGAITNDGTYFYIVTNQQNSRIAKLSFDGFIFNVIYEILVTNNNINLNYGHGIEYDLELNCIFASGVSTPAWFAKLNLDTLELTTTVLPTGYNAISDDIAISENYVYGVTENGMYRVIKVKKTDLSVSYIDTGIHLMGHGCRYNTYDKKIYVVYATNPASYITITETDVVEIFNQPSGVYQLNEIEFHEDKIWVTTWENSAKVIRIINTFDDFKNYITVESDPIFLASQANNITESDIVNIKNLSGVNTGDQSLSGKLDLDQTTPQTFINLNAPTGILRVVDNIFGVDTNKYLDTNQIFPQTITNGSPIFSSGLTTGEINSYQKYNVLTTGTINREQTRTGQFSINEDIIPSTIPNGPLDGTYYARINNEYFILTYAMDSYIDTFYANHDFSNLEAGSIVDFCIKGDKELKLSSLTGDGFIKTTGGTGVLVVDNTTYLTPESIYNKADLVDGVVPLSQLPNITITDTFIVSTSANLTTLDSANQGDIGIVTDISKTFILTQNPPSTLGNWVTLATPTDSVLSVNNKTGVVTLSASDIPGSITTGDITGEISTHNLNLSAHSNQFSSLSSHLTNFDNPHQVTKSQVGLGNVENLSISGSISTHNANLSAHQDIRYDWYLDGTALKRYDDNTFTLTTSTVSVPDKTLAITSWTGSPINIEIKTEQIKGGWSIVQIMDSAFSTDGGTTPCQTLRYISVDDAVTIGSYAFVGCENISNIIFPSVTIMNESAFGGCINLTTIHIPMIQTLNTDAFAYCTSLVDINLPSIITLIGSVFFQCTSLTSVIIPIATTLGDGLFQGCRNLTTIDAPNTITIGSSCFNSTKVTSLYFPNCTSVGSLAFRGCNTLDDIYLPNITSIGWGVFQLSTAPYINMLISIPSQVSNIDEWFLPATSKIKVPYEYVSQWQAVYPTLVIDGTWTIEAYSDNDASARIQAHNTATDSHSDIRNELDNCLSTVAVSGFDHSKQYAFVVNADGTIKNGSLQEIVIPDVSLDNSSVTENSSGNIQAVGVIDGSGVLISGSTIRSAISITWDI